MWHLLLGSFPIFWRVCLGLYILCIAAFKIFIVVAPTNVAEPRKEKGIVEERTGRDESAKLRHYQ